MAVPSEEKKNIRRLAVKAIYQIVYKGAYANIVLQQLISEHRLSDLDRRFLTELVYGVIRRLNYLDAIIVHLTKRPMKKLSPWVQAILRLGIYQLFYMDKVPASAAVNESVKLAKSLTKGLHGFVNGVMRNVVRQQDSLGIEDLAKNDREVISYVYNQPLWLVDMWVTELGLAKTEELLAWFNERPALTARVNTLVTTIDACVTAMTESGWEVALHPILPEAIIIHKHMGSLEQSAFVTNGWITFMDVASMLVAHVVNPVAGERVLDVCAAPGGKSLHMAALMGNDGYIQSCDIHEHKLQLMADNAKRLGVTCMHTALQDGRQLPETWEYTFDRVLVDVPCSGLGILQKKLDMRWRKEPKQLQELPVLQLAILERASTMVKVGGVLVYSTCTIHQGENMDVVNQFLTKHDDFTLEPIQGFSSLTADNGTITTNPAVDGIDGFFMARMRRKEAL